MFKISFSRTAIDYIIHEQQNIESEQLVVVLFYHSTETWTMSLCGNFVELVEKFKLLHDDDFDKLKDADIENEQFKTEHIEVYIEKKIIPELEDKPLTIVDAVVGEVNGKKVGLLFIKKNSNVYGC